MTQTGKAPITDTPEKRLDRADLWQKIHAILEMDDDAALLELFEDLHIADIADIIEQLDRTDRENLIKLWDAQIDPLLLLELEEGLRQEVLQHIPYSALIRGLRELDSDDLVYVLEDLEPEKRDSLLLALDKTDRSAVSKSLTYPEGSAGRMIQRDFVALPEHWNVGEAIEFIRTHEALPDHFLNVYLVNPMFKPLGYIPLSALLTSSHNQPLLELLQEDMQHFDVTTDQAEIGYAFSKYLMLSAPVIDEDGRMVGVISIEDALEIVGEEHEEDMKRLAGVGDEELSDTVWNTARLRFPWLALNLLTAILASVVIARFSNTIDAIVALAILMPIVASMGGNAGTQTLTIAVRALATKDLTRANAWRIITRELWIGLANGFIFAILVGLVGVIWFSSPALGMVLGVSMVVNLVVAGLAGILIPLVLEKLGADPALASGAFVTTVTDVVGFFAFLGLASVVLL